MPSADMALGHGSGLDLRTTPSPSPTSVRMHILVADEPYRTYFAGIELVNWPSKQLH
jgi:hypothetical protein